MARRSSVGLRKLLARWLGLSPVEVCPACGGDGRDHDFRTLARERFSPGESGIEGRLARRDFAGAAALDDPRTFGDQLVHHVLQCRDRVAVVTIAAPMALGLEPRIRRTLVLDGTEAEAAWRSAH